MQRKHRSDEMLATQRRITHQKCACADQDIQNLSTLLEQGIVTETKRFFQ